MNEFKICSECRHSMDGKRAWDEGRGIEVSTANERFSRWPASHLAFTSLFPESSLRPLRRFYLHVHPYSPSLLPPARFTSNELPSWRRSWSRKRSRILIGFFAIDHLHHLRFRRLDWLFFSLENERKRKKAICRYRRASGIITRSQSEILREMRPQRIFTDDSCSRSARGVYKLPNLPEENHPTAVSIMRGCKHEPMLGTCPCYFYETRAAYTAWSANITLRLCKEHSFLETFELDLPSKMNEHFLFNREISTTKRNYI